MRKTIVISGPYYVYELAYPDGTVFYVGKGVRNRIDAHEREARSGKQSYKCNVIRQIWESGEQIIKRKVQERLSEEAAFTLEVELIRLYGREHLTNLTDGGEGAPEGNQFAFKGGTERSIITLSLTSQRKERIRAAMTWHEGYVPGDDEVEKKARELAYLAWDEYGRKTEREQERAIIL